MGSFSEVVLGFHFRRDTPPEVLAAFAALADGADALRTDAVPPLPEPVREPEDAWAPDQFYAGGGSLMEYETAPWRHDWAAWLASSMSVAICPSAALQWSELERWHLSCRAGFKAGPDVVHACLRWLAPYIGDGFDAESATGSEQGQRRPLLVGYIKHEYLEQPNLLWLRNGSLELDGVTDADALTGVLVVVCGLPGSGREEHLTGVQRGGGRVFDRYHEAAINHDPHPMSSRYAGAVLRELESGGVVTISDVAFCSAPVQDALLAEFRQRVPGLLIQTISFANDPAQCRLNVAARAAREPGHDVGFELRQIDQFSPGYVPDGHILPVTPWTRAGDS
jgi:hypothetical protein